MYILGKKSLHFSTVDLTNKTNPSTELAYNKVMQISSGSVRNILFYTSLIHCFMLITVWLRHLFIEVTIFSNSVTDPAEWAPTRVSLPSVIGANRTRLTLVQKQRKTLYFDQRMERWECVLPCGLWAGLLCRDPVSVSGREGAELSRAGLVGAQALCRRVCTGPHELRCQHSHFALGNRVWSAGCGTSACGNLGASEIRQSTKEKMVRLYFIAQILFLSPRNF